MDKYTVLELLGEGSYGKVMKCRHNNTGITVAIKKFIETEEDTAARKVALREIRMLKKLHHPNLVSLLEVFRRKKRFHLVFEYMNCSLLDELEANGPLQEDQVRKYMYQIIRGVDYCHSYNIIHRDIKPENILISDLGIVKLCDFGFARFATISNEPFTDYVATRWYRPPELLVGDPNYGRAVDIWALGCILLEMLTGEPLFPGDSDIDQLHKITKLLGKLTERQKALLVQQSEKQIHQEEYSEDIIAQIKERFEMDPAHSLNDMYPNMDRRTIELAASSLGIDPEKRPTSEQLLKHSYFTWDKFLLWYLPELQKKIQLEVSRKIYVTDIPCTPNDLNNLGLLGERRPSNLPGGWSINFIDVGEVKDNPLYKEIVEARRQDEKAAGSSNSKVTDTPSSFQNSSDPLSKPFDSNQRVKTEELGCRDLEKATKEMPKLNVEYKRNMMPNSLYIRPVKGRLVYDKLLTLPCPGETIGKPPCEGIFLPMLKKDTKTPSEGKTSQQKRKTSGLKKIEGAIKSQREMQEEVCPCEEERRKIKTKSYKNCNFRDI